MSEGRSLYPAIERVVRWGPVRYLLGAALAVLTGVAVPWVQSRIDRDSVENLVNERGKPSTLERVRVLEERYFAQEQRVRELERAEREIRRQLVGYLATDAEPKRERKAGAADAARKMYDEFVASGMQPRAAALQVLQSPVPR